MRWVGILVLNRERGAGDEEILKLKGRVGRVQVLMFEVGVEGDEV